MFFAKLETMRAGTKVMGGEISTRLTGRVAVIEHQANGRIRMTIDVLATERPTLKYVPQRVRVSARAIPDGLKAGDVVTGAARLGPPSGPTRPGGYDFSFNSYFDGIGANGFFLTGPEMAATPVPMSARTSFFATVENLRTDLANRIRGEIGGAEGEIAAALVAGVRAGIPEDVNEALRRTGLAHMLSISGLHMALVAATIMTVLRLGFAFFPDFASRRPVKKYAASAALVALAVYLFISGTAVAAERSFIMIGVMLTAMLFDRAALTMRNLAIAAIAIIVVSPHEVAGPSFQMSFAATAGSDRRLCLVVAAPARPAAAGACGPRPCAEAGAAPGWLRDWARGNLVDRRHGDRDVRRLSFPARFPAQPRRQSGGDAVRLCDGHAVRHVRHDPHAVRPRRLGVLGDGEGADGDDRRGELVLGAVADRLGRIGSRRRRHRADRRAGAGDLADHLAAPCRLAGRAGSAWRSSPGARCPTPSSRRMARLVAVRTAGGALAVSRARPNAFTTEDWQKALMAATVVKPENVAAAAWPRPLPPINNRFRCDGQVCLARPANGAVVAYTAGASNAAALCSSASLIVIDDATAKNPCPPGSATVLTKRDLARRGAASVDFGDGSMMTCGQCHLRDRASRIGHGTTIAPSHARHAAWHLFQQEETDEAAAAGVRRPPPTRTNPVPLRTCRARRLAPISSGGSARPACPGP